VGLRCFSENAEITVLKLGIVVYGRAVDEAAISDHPIPRDFRVDVSFLSFSHNSR